MKEAFKGDASLYTKRNFLKNDTQFYYELTKFNLKRLQVISLLFPIILSSVLLANSTRGQYHSDSPSTSFILYGLLFVINMYIFLKFQPKILLLTKDILYYKKFEKIIFVYINLMLILSMVISIIDYTHYKHTITYTFTVIVLSSFFLLNSYWFIFIPVAISIVVFGFFLYMTSGYFDIYRILFLGMTVPAFAIVSHFFRTFFIQQYVNTKELQEANEKAQQLAQQLSLKNKKLEHVAMLDELTQIANRHGYHQYVEQLNLDEKPTNVTAILIDIDYFKKYNDYYGHASGDEVLKKVAKVLQQVCIQKESFVARWGGEEFLILAKNKSKEDILKLYEVIVRKIDFCKIQHAKSEVSNYLTLCVGAYQDELYTVDQLHHFIIEADSILYEVKEAGRNGFKFVKEGLVVHEKKHISQ